MENTARLFIIVIGFCFLIAFVVQDFGLPLPKPALFGKHRRGLGVRVCGEGNVAWVRFVKIKYAICHYLLHC